MARFGSGLLVLTALAACGARAGHVPPAPAQRAVEAAVPTQTFSVDSSAVVARRILAAAKPRSGPEPTRRRVGASAGLRRLRPRTRRRRGALSPRARF